jgi:hypothetical protein
LPSALCLPWNSLSGANSKIVTERTWLVLTPWRGTGVQGSKFNVQRPKRVKTLNLEH